MSTIFTLDHVHDNLPHRAYGKNRPPELSSTMTVRDDLKEIVKKIDKEVNDLYVEVDTEEGTLLVTDIDTKKLQSEISEITAYDFDFLTECSQYLDNLQSQRDYQHKAICDAILVLREASELVNIPLDHINDCLDILEDVMPSPKTLAGMYEDRNMKEFQYYAACQFEAERIRLDYQVEHGAKSSHGFSLSTNPRRLAAFNGHCLTLSSKGWSVELITEPEEVRISNYNEEGAMIACWWSPMQSLRTYFIDWMYPTPDELSLFKFATETDWVDISPYITAFIQAGNPKVDI